MKILGENYDEYLGLDEYDPYDPFEPGEPDDEPEKRQVTIDAALRILEEFISLDRDEPIIIEQCDECGNGYRHYFDSVYDVRRSREYRGDTWQGLDPVIWYDDKVYSMYRDPEVNNTFVIELEDKEDL